MASEYEQDELRADPATLPPNIFGSPADLPLGGSNGFPQSALGPPSGRVTDAVADVKESDGEPIWISL